MNTTIRILYNFCLNPKYYTPLKYILRTKFIREEAISVQRFLRKYWEDKEDVKGPGISQ